MARSLSWKTLKATYVVVCEYLKVHPVPPEVLQNLEAHVIGPSATYVITHREGWKERVLRNNRSRLASLMAHWRDPMSAKPFNGSNAGHVTPKDTHDPVTVLAVLLSATVWAESRDWRQGQAAEIFRTMHLLKLRYLPRARGQTYLVPGPTRRLLAAVIAQAVGVYLLLEARKIEAWSKVARLQPKRKLAIAPSAPKLPPRTPRPMYRTLADLEKIRRWERMDSLWTDRGL